MPSVKFDDDERGLLHHLAISIDVNLARLANAQDGVKVSTDLFQRAWQVVLRGKGLDPAKYRARWHGEHLEIVEVTDV